MVVRLHVYMTIWNLVDKEILVFTQETHNLRDRYVVSIKRNSHVVGYIP